MGMSGPLGVRSSRGSRRSAEIKGWVIQAFGLSEEVAVTVMELRCSEPGCPPVETNVVILDGQAQQYRLHKPMSEVLYEDVERLAAGLETTYTREERNERGGGR